MKNLVKDFGRLLSALAFVVYLVIVVGFTVILAIIDIVTKLLATFCSALVDIGHKWVDSFTAKKPEEESEAEVEAT